MIRKPVNRPLALSMLTAVVALSAACSGPDTEGNSTAGTSAQSTVVGQNKKAATGPAATLAEAESLVPQVRAVTARLVEKCLREKGVTEYPPQTTDAAPKTLGTPTASPDKAAAERDGYGITKSAPEDDTEKSFEFSSPAAAKKYREALSGAQSATTGSGKSRTSLGGCLATARTSVYGKVTAPDDPITGITEAAHQSYDKDEAVRTALAKWSKCLEKSDYPRLTDPEDARRYAQYFHYPVGARPDGPVPSGGPWPKGEATRKEIAMAVADAGCAAESNLNPVQETAWATALDRTLQQRSAELFGFRQAMTEALNRGQAAFKG